jgi:peptidase E
VERSPIKRQIIAMGGGGFSMEPENLALDRYILAQARVLHPKVCFVPTASGDAEGYIQRFYAAFETLPCEPSHLALFRRTVVDLEAYVLEQDVIYVGGGNTLNLLAVWQAHGLEPVLRKAWAQGVVLAGISAGSLCWHEFGVTDSRPGALTPLACLGFLPGSNCVHYDGEAECRPTYHKLLAGGAIPDGYAAEDGVALHYVDTTLEHVVSSRPGARAYRVARVGTEARETTITPRLLD